MRIGSPARISVTNCWLKIRNFSRFSRRRLPGRAISPRKTEPHALRLYRIDQESLLRIALADFLSGGALRRLAVHFAARVRVFQHEIGHVYRPASTICSAGRRMEGEHRRRDGRVQLFVGEGEVELRLILPGDSNPADLAVGSGQKFHPGISQVFRLRIGHDPGVTVAFSTRVSNDLNSLCEIQLAQQESQRRPHVFRFLQLALLQLCDPPACKGRRLCRRRGNSLPARRCYIPSACVPVCADKAPRIRSEPDVRPGVSL